VAGMEALLSICCTLQGDIIPLLIYEE